MSVFSTYFKQGGYRLYLQNKRLSVIQKTPTSYRTTASLGVSSICKMNGYDLSVSHTKCHFILVFGEGEPSKFFRKSVSALRMRKTPQLIAVCVDRNLGFGGLREGNRVGKGNK